MPYTDPAKTYAVQDRIKRERAEERWAVETAAGHEFRPLDADRIIADMESFTVPTGDGAGSRFTLAPFQRRWIREAFADGVQEAWLTCARKNGKTTFLAALCLSLLIHPPKRYYQILVAAADGGLAALFAQIVRQIAVMSGVVGPGKPVPERDMRYPRKSPALFKGPGQSELLCVNTTSRTGHGQGADVAILDEAGLFDPRFGHMVTSLGASTMARKGRLLGISIRGHSGIMEAAEQRAGSREIVFHDHSAPRDCLLNDRSAVRAANPGLGHFIDEDWMMARAEAASKGTPDQQAHFRSQHLNAGGDPAAVLAVDMEVWEEALADRDAELPPREGPVVVGLDIGGAVALTSAAMYWYETGRLEVVSCCGSVPDLPKREQYSAVGNVLQTAERLGTLLVMGNRQSDLGRFFPHLSDLLAAEHVEALLFDRYRRREVEDMLDAHGPWAGERIERVGGWKDASDDIRGAQRELLSGRVRVHRCPLLTQAFLEARVMDDGRGNMRLGKRCVNRSLSDPFSATVLALGEGHRRRREDADAGPLMAVLAEMAAA